MNTHERFWGLVLFPVVYLTFYGGLHALLFAKLTSAWALPPAAAAALAVFFLLMILAPVLDRLADRLRAERLARGFALAGYLWMGWVFLGLTAYLVLSLGRVVWERILPAAAGPAASDGLTVVWAAILSAGVGCYGLFEARAIRTARLELPTAKLAAGARIRIVQISDIHLGQIVRLSRLKRILAAVRAAGPDLLVSTGDLVDGELGELENVARCLSEVRPPLGKYAVTGNHEFYAGIDQAAAFTRRAGFTLLRDETAFPDGVLAVVGVDDSDGKYFETPAPVSEPALLAALPPERFALLLKHRPRVDAGALGRFDLQLSGHTHHGQIFPFTLATRLAFPFHSGFFRLPDGSALYTSRGSGTWGPPLRVLAPPEITVIDLVHGGAR